MKSWVAFFSMTGGEICNVSKLLNRAPDVIVTNRQDLEGVHDDLLSLIEPHQLIIIPARPSIEEYEAAIRESCAHTSDILVTLHGYLRIVPPAICERYEIINCHPGLITTYPELKGKDPQKRAALYPVIGTVLHRVTAGVDEGPVISSASCDNVYQTVDGVTHQLKYLSSGLWVELLRNKL